MAMTPKKIRQGLDEIAARDADMARGLAQVGYPQPRKRDPGLGTLLGIIAGQQVSNAAASAIRGRLEALVDPMTPEKLLSLGDEALRGAGLSARKVEYAQGLADAMLTGALDARRLARQSDEEVIAALTALRGFGRWSAEIYMLFALKRCDVWPAEDLAVAEALRRLKKLNERPSRKESEPLIEHWRPWRGVAALFLWHYYRGAPLEKDAC
jgi:DNA-3-methyladenine glycosylase II